MLTYRSFRNTDPPVLAAIWRSRVGQRGLREPISPEIFEQLIFAKLYFDYEGLIVARDDGRAVGFAHAGFGPDEAEDRLSTDLGVVSLVFTRPDCQQTEVASGLLEQCEQYLQRRGAKVLYGGGVRPLNPFYLGLYGGSELPGVLESDLLARELYGASGYQEIDRTMVLRRELGDFQAVIDRQQMQIRRQMIVEMTVDAPTESWWEACTIGPFDLLRFELIPKRGGPAIARAIFRDMEPVGLTGVQRRTGLIDLWVDESVRRRGFAVFLLSEAFRQFIREGIDTVETQTMQHNRSALGLYHKLGFHQIGQGSVFRKQ